MDKTGCKFFIAIMVVISFLFPGFSSGIINYSYRLEPKDREKNLSGKITLNGSTSMARLVDSLGEEFSKYNPDIIIEKSDTGSGAAVSSVLSGISMIGNLSRPLRKNEAHEQLEEVLIALDGIALIVNKENPIDELSTENIVKVFKGKVLNWSELGGINSSITLIGREESSGTREGFEQALGLNNLHISYDVELPESGDIISKVSNDQSAIGYISTASISGNIKALKIDGIYPTSENIINGSYIVQRPFIQIFLKNSDNSLIKKWFSFICSDQAKEIIKKEKFIPPKT